MLSTVSQATESESIETQLNHFRHLVEQTLNHYRRKFRGPDWDEIAGDADVGLVEAIHQFDSTRGMTFETYAGCKIRQAIQEGLRRRDTLSRRRRKKGLAAAVSMDAVEAESEPSLQTLEKSFDLIDNEDLVTAMLNRLDVESRRVIRMRFFEDLDIDAIAQRTGMHWRSVYRKLEKILKALKDTYDGHTG